MEHAGESGDRPPWSMLVRGKKKVKGQLYATNDRASSSLQHFRISLFS